VTSSPLFPFSPLLRALFDQNVPEVALPGLPILGVSDVKLTRDCDVLSIESPRRDVTLASIAGDSRGSFPISLVISHRRVLAIATESNGRWLIRAFQVDLNNFHHE
jgi:hypothetical protein